MSRRWGRRLAALVVALGTAATLTTTAASAAPRSCGVAWGSLPKANYQHTGYGLVVDVRGGRHECYDRLVVDVGSDASQRFYVHYVPELIADGSGFPIPLRGGAFLEVVAANPTYDVNTGAEVYAPPDRKELVNVAGYQTFRQVVLGTSFEGTTQVGLGVRARLPFQVFTLHDPDGGGRLVVDVAHSW